MPIRIQGLQLRQIFLPALLAVMAATSACSIEPQTDTVGDFVQPRSHLCVDADGDGFGFGCSLGVDCNDNDVTITDDCYRCEHSAPGCPCASEGQRISCGTVTKYFPAIDKTVCGEGGQVCTNGTWTSCELGAYAPGHDGALPNTP